MSDKQRDTNVLSYQRAISIEVIRNSGGFAVKVIKGEKAPSKGWDPKLNSLHQSDQLIYDLSVSDDNIGIHLHGNLVDVDIDSDVPYLMAALEKFLPPCSHIWGRASRPRTHRLYALKSVEPFDPADYHILNQIKKIDEAKVELRGGPQTRGEYSILPGSIHPSGEPYEWADVSKARSSLSVTTPESLLRAIRLGGAVSILAPLFTEGVRNDLVMALSGFLYRAYAIGRSIQAEEEEGAETSSIFCMDKEQSLEFLKVLLDVAEDDPSDRVARIKTFKRTWDKAEKDIAVTGGTTIAKIADDNHILRKLYLLLTDSRDIATIEEFISRFAIWQGPGIIIDMEGAKAGVMKPFMTRQAFVNSYGHKFVAINGKKKLLPDLLFHMSSTTRVAGVTFEPGQPVLVEAREGLLVNQWGGCEIPPWEGTVSDADIQMFIDYVKLVLADGDKETYEWIMAWVADIFQNPGNKCGTALTLVGLPGAGKSFLGHSIIGRIIGKLHYGSTNNVESITKDFNVAFDNKIFIQADEATSIRQKLMSKRLLSLITDPYKLVEPKGIDAYHKPNHSRFLFTSNDEQDALDISHGEDDRRYTVIKVSSSKIGRSSKNEYWNPFVNWLTDERLSKIHKWLLQYKYSRSLIQAPIITDVKRDMAQRSWNAVDGWLASMVAREHPLADEVHEHWSDALYNIKAKVISRDEWPTFINLSALVKDYTRYVRINRIKYADPLNEIQLMREFRRRGLDIGEENSKRLRAEVFDEKRNSKVIRRIRLYEFPSMDRVATFLENKYGLNVAHKVIDEISEDIVTSSVPESKEF